MIERHLRVLRTARFQQLGTSTPSIRDVWFACHGYGQLAAAFARHFEPLASGSRLIVVPEALSRFYLDALEQGADSRRVGATWMTREDREHEITDYVEYLDAVHRAILDEVPPDVRVHVLGFSQGVATVVRWVALGAVRADTLTLWAGGLPHDLALERHAGRLARMTVTIVAGDRDRMVTDEKLAAARDGLLTAGIAHEVVRFDGGHRLDDAVLRRLAEQR